MKIALLGYGLQGQAAAEYWGTPENQLTICDQNEISVPAGIATRFGDDYLKDLDQFDLLVRTPVLHPNDITAANPDHPHILEKVTTVTNEFFKVCPSKNIIGITGTKGKGTTSSLVTEILRAAGKTVHLGGNIGIPPLSMLKDNIQPNDWVVLELANFQLIDLKISPKIATCLMVVPEHLNWHSDMEEYVVAKQQLFAHQTVHDIAIYNRANAHSQEVASVSPATKLSYEVPGPGAEPQQTTGAYLKGDTIYMNDVEVCKTSDVALLGRHNIENVCAAVATVWELIEHNTTVIKQVVGQFKGLEHRLERVRESNGITYFNDSFAATPEACMAAMNAIPGPKVMIVGGFDRNLPLDGLVQTFALHQGDIRVALLIGASAKRLADGLDKASFSNYQVLDSTSMSEIVAKAKAQAKAGDSIVLSPGFASFDMFKNFEDRGNQYKTVVKAL